MSQSGQAESPAEGTREKFYVTTPIYYVNARPHIGHAYSTIVADVLARRHRLLGHNTWFLTGTDEHGQKIERSAAAAGVPPQEFADQVSKTFSDLWKRMGITNDDFIRTTEPRHVRGVQKLFETLYDLGHIYLSTYTGQYSVGEEMFVDGPPGTIGPDGRPTETVTEENFFFRLSAFQEQLIDLIEGDDPVLKITPESSRKEVLSFLRGNVPNAAEIDLHKMSLKDLEMYRASLGTGDQVSLLKSGNDLNSPIAWSNAGQPYVRGALKDLSVSRSSFTWGITVPERVQREAGTTQKHVIYVWLDALVNYMTAVGYGDNANTAEFQKWWPADLHLVGKEITRFHCIYWPAFLLALNPGLEAEGPARPVAWATAGAEVSGEEHGLPPVGSPSEQQISFENDHQKGNSVDWEWVKEWLPKRVTANGWLLFDQSKMSKSKGNVVRTETILDGFGDHVYGKQFPESSKEERDLFAADVLRYYLLREIPFGQDGSFSFESMVTRYNADLANGYGNLVSRTLNMLNQYNAGEVLVEDRSEWDERAWLDYAFSKSPSLTAWSDPKEEFDHKSLSVYGMFQTIEHATRACELIAGKYGDVGFQAQLAEIALTVSMTDGFITSTAPWKIVKQEESRDWLNDVLYTSAESIRIVTALLYPFLPSCTGKVWQQLGLGSIKEATEKGYLQNLKWGGLKAGTKLGPLAPIFPRADKSLSQVMMEMEAVTPPLAKDAKDGAPGPGGALEQSKTKGQNMPTEDTSQQAAVAETHPAAPLKGATTPAPVPNVPDDSTHPAAPPRTSSLESENAGGHVAGSAAVTTERVGTPPHTEAAASGIFSGSAGVGSGETAQIRIEDFAKVDLRVAKVLVAERIPKADKLLRLEVDLGYEQRQILSGIAEWYAPEELVGRKIVVIANLAPRKMRGLESRGMLLAASEGENGRPVLATFGEEIAVGTRLR